MCVQIFTFRGQNPYFAYISSPFSFLGLLGGIFHFIQTSQKLSKQTVENLIRRRVLRRLICFFALFADVPQKRR